MSARVIYLTGLRIAPELERPLDLPNSPFMVRPVRNSEITSRTIHSIAHLEILLKNGIPLWEDRHWRDTLQHVALECDKHRKLLTRHFLPSLGEKNTSLHFIIETEKPLRLFFTVSEERIGL